MSMFLQSLGNWVTKAVTKPFSVPVGDEKTWPNIATKKFDVNAKAHYALLQALNEDDIARVIHYKSIYEICHTYWSRTRELHKSRELRLISCVSNMKISPCMIMTPLMTWL